MGDVPEGERQPGDRRHADRRPGGHSRRSTAGRGAREAGEADDDREVEATADRRGHPLQQEAQPPEQDRHPHAHDQRKGDRGGLANAPRIVNQVGSSPRRARSGWAIANPVRPRIASSCPLGLSSAGARPAAQATSGPLAHRERSDVAIVVAARGIRRCGARWPSG